MASGGFRKYLMRKTFVYLITFLFAVTLNWLLPRLMPGNPIEGMMAQAGTGGAVLTMLWCGSMRGFTGSISLSGSSS
ncbi:hypothetical protein [Thermococcus sp. JCM 11816]|uniref:hypothetical protein n=1 Tax=Thermococcus sp. (strain JCM 11816 / KS-1) TaxID=1295125 RepID=UPI000B072130